GQSGAPGSAKIASARSSASRPAAFFFARRWVMPRARRVASRERILEPVVLGARVLERPQRTGEIAAGGAQETAVASASGEGRGTPDSTRTLLVTREQELCLAQPPERDQRLDVVDDEAEHARLYVAGRFRACHRPGEVFMSFGGLPDGQLEQSERLQRDPPGVVRARLVRQRERPLGRLARRCDAPEDSVEERPLSEAPAFDKRLPAHLERTLVRILHEPSRLGPVSQDGLGATQDEEQHRDRALVAPFDCLLVEPPELGSRLVRTIRESPEKAGAQCARVAEDMKLVIGEAVSVVRAGPTR